ncbi:hypothetical protein BDB00DRAFT_829002 [Zychaea mexicana]|uniref:uncharacterized protein n=1 Tax=Zychaea mexicana TaxID=64656 RepID=UPI0022FEF1C5|nr:uncharacterized protein BDB00DRAFT_829002 [Zychaea mexicana]KAI9492240.1 hypothetical protein BDB00DRAFT_829002 [Zychaea mexicana]
MGDRLYTNRTTLISFCLGFSGSALGLATAQWGFQNHMDEQLSTWREAMLHMRRRLEIGGGVPYLLRDEEFVAYWGQRPMPRYRRREAQRDAFKRCLQHEWNCGVRATATSLSNLLARRYEK